MASLEIATSSCFYVVYVLVGRSIHTCKSSLYCQQLGKEGAVPLTNSISLAERHRIKHSIKQARGKQYRDFCPFRHGKRLTLSAV